MENPYILFILCPLIFLAGFIDSIAGGGGLISLTAYMACGLSGSFALGTNKFSSSLGSTFASVNYIRTGNFDLKATVSAAVTALLGSWIGSTLTMLVDSRLFTYFMLVAAPVIAVLSIVDKNYANHEKELSAVKVVMISLVIGLVMGVYDGFYGPGTGVFLQMGFILIAGLNVKKACGTSRIVNWASNIAALANFIISGSVIYAIAIPCAFCSILGNITGSRLAIKKDVKIIKPMMVCVVILLCIKLFVDLIK